MTQLYEETMANVARNQNDCVFRMLFKSKERFLELYNALNHSNHTDVLLLNINDGYNEELKENCDTLREYMLYVNKIRKYAKDHKREQAIQIAVNECIQENILKDFLLQNKAEVIAMSIYEFDEEKYKEDTYNEGWEDGRSEGLSEGKRIGLSEGLSLLSKLIQFLIRDNRNNLIEQVTKDSDLRELLLTEYHLK